MRAFETIAALVPEVGDTSSEPFGTFAIRGTGRGATRYLTCARVGPDEIVVRLFGSVIARLYPHGTRLWCCGYGDRATTRAALDSIARLDGWHVHSSKRLLWLGKGWGPESVAVPFREGIAYDRSGVYDHGRGDQQAGAPARKRRAS